MRKTLKSYIVISHAVKWKVIAPQTLFKLYHVLEAGEVGKVT